MINKPGWQGNLFQELALGRGASHNVKLLFYLSYRRNDMQFIILLVGLLLIVKSADVLIESTSEIAGRFGISSFVIGLTVVAFGTSAPELAVGILSAISKSNELTLGNVIGSTFSNIAFIIGITAIISPLLVDKSVLKKEFPILIMIEIILILMIVINPMITRVDGFIFIVLFAIFMIYIYKNAKNVKDEKIQTSDKEENNKPIKREIAIAFISLVGLFLGGKFTVDSSTAIALDFGMSETLIGLTVVSIATTLPELITSVVAVKKGSTEIVLGNCLGSNIFNILLVLGSSSLINPIPVNEVSKLNAIGMIGITLFVFIVAKLKGKISKSIGITLFVFYILYILANIQIVL